MRELSTRSLTLAYLIALGIVGLLSLFSHLTLYRVLSEHRSAGAVINESGRQRMLSQRIASLAAQSALGDLTAKSELGHAIDSFAIAHRNLIQGDLETHLPPEQSPDLLRLYYDGPVSLDAQVTEFLSLARAVQTSLPSDPRLPDLLKPLFAMARQPLLDRLNAVVSMHQQASEKQLEFLQRLQNAMITFVFLTLICEAIGIFRPMVRRIISYTTSIVLLAASDPLTGALNRRSFTERALAELNRAKRAGHQICLLMIDADMFKSINDTHGHAAGDAVLRELTSYVAKSLRPSDLCGRIGGEEFAILLTDTGLDGAEVVAERIRKGLAALTIPFGDKQIRFTVSIGLAAFDRDDVSLETTMQRADHALYNAKNSGRNRVAIAGGETPGVTSSSVVMAMA